MAFTASQLKEDIRILLGEEKIEVELGEKAMDTILRRTLEMYSRYKPLLRHDTWTVVDAGMWAHQFDADVTGVFTLEQIVTINQTLVTGGILESLQLAGVPLYYGVGDVGLDIEYYDLRRRWLKTIARELGVDPDWAIVRDEVTQRLTAYTFATSGCYVDATVIIEHNKDLSTIPPYHHKWVFDWAMSEAMIVLGRTRGKFNKIMVAGNTVSMDGPALIAEARDQQEKLMTDMQATRSDMAPRMA